MLKILIFMLFFFKIGDSYKIVKVTQYYDDLDRQSPIILYDEVKVTRFIVRFSHSYTSRIMEWTWRYQGFPRGTSGVFPDSGERESSLDTVHYGPQTADLLCLPTRTTRTTTFSSEPTETTKTPMCMLTSELRL